MRRDAETERYVDIGAMIVTSIDSETASEPYGNLLLAFC